MTGKTLDKKQDLNYRRGEGGRVCEDCTHFDEDNYRCAVIGGGVAGKYEVEPDFMCDVWNDMQVNNTWLLPLVREGEKAYIQIFDTQDNPHGKDLMRTDLGVYEIVDATNDLPGKIFGRLKELIQKHGAPDEIVNLNGEAVLNSKLKMYLKGVGIKYRYMKNESEDVEDERNQGLSVLDLLSIEIDAFLQTESALGNEK